MKGRLDYEGIAIYFIILSSIILSLLSPESLLEYNTEIFLLFPFFTLIYTSWKIVKEEKYIKLFILSFISCVLISLLEINQKYPFYFLVNPEIFWDRLSWLSPILLYFSGVSLIIFLIRIVKIMLNSEISKFKYCFKFVCFSFLFGSIILLFYFLRENYYFPNPKKIFFYNILSISFIFFLLLIFRKKFKTLLLDLLIISLLFLPLTSFEYVDYKKNLPNFAQRIKKEKNFENKILLINKNKFLNRRERQYYLGKIYYENKNYEKAEECFKELIKNPDLKLIDAYYYLAWVYKENGRKKEYFEILKEIEKNFGSSSKRAMYELANFFYKEGDKEKAIDYLIKAFEFKETEKEIKYFYYIKNEDEIEREKILTLLLKWVKEIEKKDKDKAIRYYKEILYTEYF
jgi:tetratricopeptide (TPR) repeat protein